MDDRGASRTAVLVCQGRAVADGVLAPDRFHDPVAVQLLTDDERAAVTRARQAEPPSTARDRLAWERLRACAEGMVPRTVLIDGAVQTAGHPQLVIVGAGLDTRPWRMSELGDTEVYSVDHAASQADCRRRAAALRPVVGHLEFVTVDLGAESLQPPLTDAGHQRAAPTTWLWEGVVPYLPAADVEETLAALSERSAAGSTLVVQYQAPSLVAGVGRHVSAFTARRTGLDDPLADEPWRSLWRSTTMATLLARHGFLVDRDEHLLGAATRIGSPTRHRRSLSAGRVAVANRR